MTSYKQLEEKFTKSEGEEKDKIKKLIKMEETTLTRLNKELQKYTPGHTRMASAPVVVIQAKNSHQEDNGDEGNQVDTLS